jgi:hypothetical protein
MNKSQEFIIEMIPQGKFVKVTAIDVSSGREVSVVGASSANQNDLHTLAINKLKYVMNRDREKNISPLSGTSHKRGFEA